MAIRHFKRQFEEDDSDSGSSVSSSGQEEQETGQIQQALVEAEMSERDEADSDQDSESSSSSDGEGFVQLERPLFLRNGKRKHTTEDESQEKELKKRGTVMEKVQHENQAIKAREQLEIQMKSNYSADNDITARAMLLDDDDSIDPEHERQQWIRRQESRRQRRRDAMVARQMEVEEYEANKLKFGGIDEPVNDDKSATHNALPDKGHFENNSSRKWRPSRAQVTQFAEINGSSGNSKEETEYSCI